MPALKICGNRTFLAGDDLRTYTAFAIALRIVQIGALIPFTYHTAGHFTTQLPAGCQGNHLLENTAAIFVPYVILAFILAVAGLGLELGIMKTTGKGTPTQPEKRWMLRPLCWIKMVPMSLLRLAVLVFTTLAILAIRDLCRCDACPKAEFKEWNGKEQKKHAMVMISHCYVRALWHLKRTTCLLTHKQHHYFLFLSLPRLVMFSIIAVSHLIESFGVAMYATYFGCKARPRLPIKTPSAQTKWRIFCKCCCTVSSILTCCLAGGRDSQASSDFAELAMILADYFDGGGILDVVMSDIIVGFRMLAREQKQRELLSRSEVINRSSIIQQSRSTDPSAVDNKRRDQEEEDIELGENQRMNDGGEEMGIHRPATTARVRLLSRKDASDKYTICTGRLFLSTTTFIPRRTNSESMPHHGEGHY